MLEVDVKRALGRFTLQARFTAGEGITVLFGKSGAGKTSILNMIAGLDRPESGRIVSNGTVLFDSGARVAVPVHRRAIGYMFQDARLFPHLNVSQNLRYGRWFTPASRRYANLKRVVKLLDIEDLLERRPASLSGGEKQRVAVGRALLSSPRILLMDEPLASLDEQRKEEILPYIERLRDEMNIPIVYVTHSVDEVARLAATMVLVSEGRVKAVGSAPEVLGRADLFPMTGRFEAGALIECTVAGHERESGLTRLASAAGELLVPHHEAAVGTTLRVRIRSRDIVLSRSRPEATSALNVVPARVLNVITDMPFANVRLDCGGALLVARITQRSAERMALTAGDALFAMIKATAFDRRSLGTANWSWDR